MTTLVSRLALAVLFLGASAASQDAPAAPAAPDAPKEAAAQPAAPQDAAAEPAAASAGMDSATLEQLVAPIALYPDDLLAQTLMASTYPLEIVQAARWLEKNPGLTGDKLEEALKVNDWDPSVKALCGFPDVLKQMNEFLDWTQDLGDAYLGQKEELFATIQRMRQKAKEAGSLESNEHQSVSQDGDVFLIQSTDPEVIYVPVYSPLVVYGPGWYYPAWHYPYWYRPVPPGTGLIIFGAGVAWGHAMWGHCNWHGGDIDIDIDHHNNFVKNTDHAGAKNKLADRAGNRAEFKHDPEHRRGVNYRDNKVAKTYERPTTGGIDRDAARGFDRGSSSSGAARPSTRPATPVAKPDVPAARPATPAAKPDVPAARPSAPDRTPAARPDTPAARPSEPDRTPAAKPAPRPSNSSALSGSRSPSLDRAGSARGSSSRGASRGGGGGRGGGGRGR